MNSNPPYIKHLAPSGFSALELMKMISKIYDEDKMILDIPIDILGNEIKVGDLCIIPSTNSSVILSRFHHTSDQSFIFVNEPKVKSHIRSYRRIVSRYDYSNYSPIKNCLRIEKEDEYKYLK